MKKIAALLISAWILCAISVGCGGSNSNVPAKINGKVTYKGAPVTGGQMTFFYESAGVYPVAISADGSFNAVDLPTGTAVVTVDTELLNPKKKTPKYGGGRGGMSAPPEGVNSGPSGTYVAIPAKYRTRGASDLKVEVKAGSQDLDINIPG